MLYYVEMDENRAEELGSQLAAELIMLTAASAFALNEFVKYLAREHEKETEIQNFFRQNSVKVDACQTRACQAMESIAELRAKLSLLEQELMVDKTGETVVG